MRRRGRGERRAAAVIHGDHAAEARRGRAAAPAGAAAPTTTSLGAGLATGLTLPGLPKEAVGVLIFSCLAVSVIRR